MFTIVAFSESQDNAGAYGNVSAVVDQHVKAIGDKITVPKQMNLLLGAAAFVGTLGNHARLVSPALRRFNPYMVSPPTLLLVPPAVHPEWLKPQNAFPLSVDEGLEAEEDANPAAAERHTIIACLGDAVPSPVAGPMVTVHAQITLAQLAGAWALSELTMIDDIPVGTYAVVGANLIAAGAVAFRLVPVGASHRPGGLASQDADDLPIWYQRNGSMGVWCDFDTTQPPSVEVLGSAAAGSATYDIFLDLVAQ